MSGERAFGAWLQAQLELRGLVGVNVAAEALGVEQSTLSRWLGGSRLPQRRGVLVLARALGLPAAEVQDAVDADPARVALDNPPPPVQDQLEEIRRTMGAIAAKLAAAPPPVARGRLPPLMRVQESAGPFPGRPGGRIKPVVLTDPALRAAVGAAEEMVVWIVDATGPQPGYWVRVGRSDPPVVKPWEEGDDVTGVVSHLQAAVHA